MASTAMAGTVEQRRLTFVMQIDGRYKGFDKKGGGDRLEARTMTVAVMVLGNMKPNKKR